MSEVALTEQLDQAIEAMLRNPDAPLAGTDPQVAELVGIAVELRSLPGADFKARLKDELERETLMSTKAQSTQSTESPQSKIREGFRTFVRARLPADCKAEFISHAGAPAISLDWNMEQLAAAQSALTQEWGRDALLIGSGASIPIVADFKRTLGLDTVLVGFGLDDDNIHSPNEKYDLKSFHKGIRSWARILAALAEAPR